MKFVQVVVPFIGLICGLRSAMNSSLAWRLNRDLHFAFHLVIIPNFNFDTSGY